MKSLTTLVFLLAALIAAAALPTRAQEPSGSVAVAVKVGRLLDVRSGNYLSDQLILIDGSKVREVGNARDVQPHVPVGARTIDLSRYTVLPGLIDAHTHLTFDTTSMGYRGLGISFPREALIGARNARVTLQAGFTTVRNVGAVSVYPTAPTLRTVVKPACK